MADGMDEVCIEFAENTFCILLTTSLWKRWLSVGQKFGFSKLATVQEETHAFVSILLDIADLQSVQQDAVFAFCEDSKVDSNTSALANESDIPLWSQKSVPEDGGPIELTLISQHDARTDDQMVYLSTASTETVDTTKTVDGANVSEILMPSSNSGSTNGKDAVSVNVAVIRNESTSMGVSTTGKESCTVECTNSVNASVSASRRRRSGRQRRKSPEDFTDLSVRESENPSQIPRKQTTSGRSVRLPACLSAYVVDDAACPQSPVSTIDEVADDEIVGDPPYAAFGKTHATENSTSSKDLESINTANLPAKASEGDVDSGGGESRKTSADDTTDHLGLPKPRRGRPKNEPSACAACGCLLTGWLHVQTHYRRQHPGLPLPPKPRRQASHVCKQCGESFTKFKFLQSHTEAIHTTLEFKCETCRKSFSSNYKLVQHRRATHNATSTFMCDQCGKEYKSETSLRVHVGSVHLGVRYRCDVCGRPYTTKQHLEAHVAEAHSRTHQYVCEECGAAYFTRGKLRRHMAMHKEAHLPCSRCEKRFRDARSLRLHQISHSTARNFACPLCTKTFKRHAHVYRHLRFSHQPTLPPDQIISGDVSVMGQNTAKQHYVDGQSQISTTTSVPLTANDGIEPRVVTLVTSQMSETLTVDDHHLQQLIEPTEDAAAAAFLTSSNTCANVQLLDSNADHDTVEIVVVTTGDGGNMDTSVSLENDPAGGL